MTKLFIVEITIRYPTSKEFTYESKVVADSEEEAVSKLIQYEIITEAMIIESSAVEIEGVIV